MDVLHLLCRKCNICIRVGPRRPEVMVETKRSAFILAFSSIMPMVNSHLISYLIQDMCLSCLLVLVSDFLFATASFPTWKLNRFVLYSNILQLGFDLRHMS